MATSVACLLLSPPLRRGAALQNSLRAFELLATRG